MGERKVCVFSLTVSVEHTWRAEEYGKGRGKTDGGEKEGGGL